MNSRSISTTCVHSGGDPEPVTGAIMPPIFQTSTYVQSAPGEHKGYDYSRAGNPTREHYETALAAIEGAKFGLAFSSGLAAEQAIIQLLDPGARVLVCDDVYGGTGRLFRTLFAKYGIEFDFIDMSDLETVTASFSRPVQMVWVETPTNPMLKLIDLQALSELCSKHQASLVVDNTFATPIFQNPLSHGADIVVHSTTKYICGHSDTIGGALMVNDDELYERLKYVQFAAGAVPGPLECFLLLRSVRTLAVRMVQHEKNVWEVATFLKQHKRVTKVYFPGFEDHPNFEVGRKQMSGHSGMISFDFAGSYEEVVRFTQNLKIFALAESLGGFESLINHPETMTHASVPPKLRKQLGINETLLRLSVGIEDPSDLVADLAQAFDR